ncbi:MAG TPA: hypothetical protein VMA36_04760 [Candidatus Limnocylindria bacterium]|nr:hypothetical protein [Candidatus Limnocylindria bacterium]
MIANPAAASHLAELEARVESHLGAVRVRAAQLRERLGADAAALRAQLASAQPARVPAPGLLLDAPLVPDVPLLVLDEDVPLGPDA